MSANIGSLPLKPVLTRAVARAIVKTAQAKAGEDRLSVCVAVVDTGGHLLEFSRMDDLHVGTVEVACGKARAAALFKKSTEAFAEAISSGVSGMLSLPGMVAMPGGVPVFSGTTLLGAVGVSGASPQQDAAIAEAAAGILPTYGDEA